VSLYEADLVAVAEAIDQYRNDLPKSNSMTANVSGQSEALEYPLDGLAQHIVSEIVKVLVRK
jgi:hypothetical protein